MLSFLYQDYMIAEDYEENYEDYFNFMEADDIELKEEPEKDPKDFTFYFRDHLQIPYIKDKLKEPRIRQSVVDFVGKFIDDNSAKLSTIGPTHMILFLDKDTKFFYDLFGVTKEEIIKMMADIKKENETFKKNNDLINLKGMPHKVLLIAILIEAIQNNYSDIIESLRYIYGITDYGVLFRKYWKLGVKEEVMNYTIENLPSNKYIAKKLNNVLAWYKYNVDTAIDFHLPRLAKGYDWEYKAFADRVRTNFNNGFRIISHFYYDNVKENKAIITQTSKYDDGKLAEQEGQQKYMATAVDKSLNGFISSELNTRVIKMISQAGELDPSQLTNFLNQIFNDKRNRLERMVEAIIGSYFQYNPSAIGVSGGEFLNFGIGLYKSIATSKRELYIAIKQIMNIWIDEIIDIKKYFKGSTTISNYSRGIFNYIIIMINHYN